MGTLQSESFTNSSANSAGKFYADKRLVENGTAAAGSLTIAYDATNQSYTISTAGRSATFAPANLVASGSAAFTTFEKLGATREALTLTTPATSGALTYQYVGGGAWERGTLSNGELNYSYDPFTYGAETPDGRLQQRSGTGLYSVSLVGARAIDAQYAMAGSGSLQIDFGSGTLSTSGVLTTIDLETSLIKGLGVYYGEGALTSGLGAFTGTFAMDDGKRFYGGWNGRFYGPDGQEVGASWYLSSADGEVAAGYLLGREDATVAGLNNALTQLQFSEAFEHRFSQVSFTDLGGNVAANNAFLLRSTAELSFDASQGSYTYADTARGINTTFNAGSLNSAASTSSLAVYNITSTNGLSYKLSLNKAGSGNSAIALSYASFGRWERAQAAGNDRMDRWFTWGLRTNAFQIPTGTGTFDGIIRGTGVKLQGGATYALSGTSQFNMDFNAGTFTGTLHPIGTNLADNSQRNFGTFTFARGAIDIDAGLNADVNSGSTYLGFFEGALYGPTATEVAGTFGFQTEATSANNPGGADAAYLSGIAVAKRTGN